MVRAWIAAAASIVAVSAVHAQTPFAKEPPGLWPGPMQGATPATLTGGTVLDATALADLIARERPTLIDVANIEQLAGERKAAEWIPIHLSIPGATWLPGAGSGKNTPGFADAFAERIGSVTRGDKNKPIVTFCHAQRWGSWNAAKRLTALGYKHVYWYPGGSEGWGVQASMKALGEDPNWRAAGFDKSSAGDRPDGPDH